MDSRIGNGTSADVGVGLVAYSPLGRGFLTGAFQKPEDIAPGNFRKFAPRFQGENFERNYQIVEKLKEITLVKNYTAAQLALAWLLAQGEDIVPIKTSPAARREPGGGRD